MSALSRRPYVPFCRVRIVSQSVSSEGHMATIFAEPDGRFRPICHVCGTPARTVHSRERRSLRDLNLGAARVWITCRKVYVLGSHL